MMFMNLIVASFLAVAVNCNSDSSSSSSSTSSIDNKPIIYYPKKGKFVVVRILSNDDAYPAVCYRNGLEPAYVSKKSLKWALGAIKEACVERAWIEEYTPCKSCHDQPTTIAWDAKHSGRVELWLESNREKAYALCQKSREQICRETGKKCDLKYKKYGRKNYRKHSSSSSDDDDYNRKYKLKEKKTCKGKDC